MSVVLSRPAVASCGLLWPLLLQQYINHGGVLWKVGLLLLLLLLPPTLPPSQVYVVGDNYKLVPRSSTRNFSPATAEAAAGSASGDASGGASGDVLPFDSSQLRASAKKEKSGGGGGCSCSSSSDTHPVFSPPAPQDTAALKPPPRDLMLALLQEIQRLDISL